MNSGEGREGLPGGPEAMSPLELAELDFDLAHEGFLAACERYTAEPTVANAEAITESTAPLIWSFDESVKAILAAVPHWSDRAVKIAALIIRDDRDRTSKFNALTDSRNFHEVTESFPQLAQQIYEDIGLVLDDDQLARNKIVEIFGAIQQTDLDTLESLVPVTETEYCDSDLSQLDEDAAYEAVLDGLVAKAFSKPDLKRAIARHALDVGKIAAGVAIGLWLTKRWRD